MSIDLDNTSVDKGCRLFYTYTIFTVLNLIVARDVMTDVSQSLFEAMRN